jgi:formate hydrogenlyase subunit 3/multisubunit Na+/H+ antiporter MnhD subunit
MVPVFVLSTMAPAAMHALTTLGDLYPAVLQNQLMFDIYRWLGTATVVLGGIAAAAQRRWGYLVGCALLVDWGAGLIALGLGTDQGMVWMIEMLAWRALSLLPVGIGLTVLVGATGPEDDIARSRGMLRARLLAVLALTGGLLSLGGFPLTPGFLGRWALIEQLLGEYPAAAWVLILGGVGVSLGALGGLAACLGPVPEDLETRRLPALIGTVISVVTLWLVGTLTLHPEPWIELATAMLGSPSFLP